MRSLDLASRQPRFASQLSERLERFIRQSGRTPCAGDANEANKRLSNLLVRGGQAQLLGSSGALRPMKGLEGR